MTDENPDETDRPPEAERGSVAEVQSRVIARIQATHLGAELAAHGITTVALDEHGQLTEYRPDGTSAPL
jgi:hypothetical protein